MGVTHYATVVFGYKETPAMAKARKVVRAIPTEVCSENIKHKLDPWKTPAFCPHCGSKVELQDVPTPKTLLPAKHYSAPEIGDLPSDPDSIYDYMSDVYIHEASPNSAESDTILGLSFMSKEVRSEEGAFPIPVPTPEQVEQVEKMLAHNGIHPEPGELRIFLLIGGF